MSNNMKWDKDFPEFDSYLEQWKYVKKHHPTSLDNILYDGWVNKAQCWKYLPGRRKHYNTTYV